MHVCSPSVTELSQSSHKITTPKEIAFRAESVFYCASLFAPFSIDFFKICSPYPDEWARRQGAYRRNYIKKLFVSLYLITALNGDTGKLTVTQLVKKFLTSHGTRRFMTVFITTCH